MVSISTLTSGPSYFGFDSKRSQNLSTLPRCLEEIGRWLENVDRTHLVLAWLVATGWWETGTNLIFRKNISRFVSPQSWYVTFKASRVKQH